MKKTAIALAAMTLFCGAAFAQQGTVQRDVNQQQRIEDGLKSGSLSTKEASRLEGEESRIQRDQARAMKDGKLSPAEKARLQREQDRASRDINRDTHNAQKGNPNSASSQRMQADVQRNINQQQRIENGVKSGQLTNKETARLERGQANTERREARAGANGKVSAHEQNRIQSAENRQSERIHKQKHDAQTK